MFRRITLSCIALSCCWTLSAQEYRNCVRLDDLNGNVRSVESRMTKTAEDTTRFYKYYEHTFRDVNSLFEYDSLGFRYHSIYYEEGKSPLEGFESYDAQKRLVTYDFFRDGKSESGTKLSLLGNGSAVECRYEKGQLIEESVLSYDRFGRVVSIEVILQPESEDVIAKTYSVDSLEQLIITTAITDKWDDLVRTTVEHIDTLGRLIYTSDQFYSDSHMFREYTYSYNQQNKLIVFEDGNGIPEMQKQRMDFVYNEYGDCFEYRTLSGEELFEIVRIEYKYDDQHNWIDQQIFVNGVLEALIRREISYY